MRAEYFELIRGFKGDEKTEEAGKAEKRLKGALTTVSTLASLSTHSKFLMDNLDVAVVFQ